MIVNKRPRVVFVMMLVVMLLAGLPRTTARADSNTYTTAGTFTWTAPAGVTSVTVEVWGGGGRGGSVPGGGSEDQGGGGGGGAYSIKANIAVTPGNDYTVFVGAGSNSAAAGGDSYFIDNTTVMAKGGNSATSSTGATGGAAASGVGDTRYSGGNGADGNLASNYGGGGGSSAGTAANGTTATNATGAIAPTGGGNGGAGRSGSSGSGTAGSTPGGAGGGAYRSSGGGPETGGSGAAGQVVITYKYDTTTSVSCTSPVTYGNSSSCTATVTRSGGGTTPSGNVTWSTSDSGTFGTSTCTNPTAATLQCTAAYTPSSVGDGTHQVTATYAGDTNFNGSSGSQNVTVNKVTPTLSVTNSPVTYNGSPQAATVVGSVEGTVSNVRYDGSLTVPTDAGTYAVTADFVPTDTTNYNSLTGAAAGDFVIDKADQTISVTGPAPVSAVYNTSFIVTATASSGLSVAYSSSGVCTNVGSTFTMTSGAGACTVQYDQAGDANYNPATQVTETVNAQKADQTISVTTPAPANAAFDTDFTVAATASSGLPVTYSASGVCTNVDETFTMTSATGTCTVQYDQAGDTNYNPATQVTETVNAQKANTTTSLASSANPSVVGLNVTFTATVAPSSATGTVQFYADGLALGSAAAVSGGTASVGSATLIVGTHEITATYSGDSNFNASTSAPLVQTVVDAANIYLPLILR